MTAPNTLAVKISSKSFRLMFHPCDVDYIRNVCHGKCCDSKPSAKTYVLPAEVAPIEARGAKVEGGMIVARADGKCPFKQDDHLCGIHLSGEKPRACHVTPFTLNSNNTMVLTNRHKKLPCFKDEGAVPAYVAYRASLDLIFGLPKAAEICAHLDAGGGDIIVDLDAAMVTFIINKRDAYKGYNGLAVRPQKAKKEEPLLWS